GSLPAVSARASAFAAIARAILETEAALPAGEQRFSANRKVFVEHVAAQNPIGTEMAKIVAQHGGADGLRAAMIAGAAVQLCGAFAAWVTIRTRTRNTSKCAK